ncbi:hypothetical protein NDU88_001003 [Pleurodeles waltl]|uniref:Reverse transcriptase n=1 Tax=Pleurodeles waltl TaxID=8319 RepID=A0AAV7WH51_PLEWA|nr:hypothetical protein NDU88_001003 [Pleurodeles waltl]
MESTKSLTRGIEDYFTLNTGTVSSAITLWEASKPVLRGIDISICASKRRHRAQKLTELEAQIKALDALSGMTGGVLAQRRLILVQQQHDGQLLSDEAKLIWPATQSRFYQWGDKSIKLLNRLCQAATQSAALPLLRYKQYALTTDPRELVFRFLTFYWATYARQNPLSHDQITELVEALPLQTLSSEGHRALEMELTEAELFFSTDRSPYRKAPGSNGLPGEFPKAFMPKLGRHILQEIHDHVAMAALPSNWRHAEIVVFPKPGWPPRPLDDLTPYHLISLLNVEAKLLAKALVNRLLPDQNSCTLIWLASCQGELHNIT